MTRDRMPIGRDLEKCPRCGALEAYMTDHTTVVFDCQTLVVHGEVYPGPDCQPKGEAE